jgi:hypothetical protein
LILPLLLLRFHLLYLPFPFNYSFLHPSVPFPLSFVLFIYFLSSSSFIPLLISFYFSSFPSPSPPFFLYFLLSFCFSSHYYSPFRSLPNFSSLPISYSLFSSSPFPEPDYKFRRS